MSTLKNTKIYAGYVQSWKESFSGYSAVDYTCKIHFKLQSHEKITLTGVPDDTDFKFSTSRATFDVNGNYKYEIVLTKDGIDVIYESGIIHIHPSANLSGDTRSTWHRIYDNLIAAYDQMIEDGRLQTSITINGRTTSYDRKQLLVEITNAANRAGISSDGVGKKKGVRRVFVRFRK